jgi:hypothetical protein
MTIEEQTRQRQGALHAANARRMAISEYKKHIATYPIDEGRVIVADFLVESDTWGELGGIRVGQLLMAISKIGHEKARWYVKAAGIWSGDRRVMDLTERQRYALSCLLRNCRSFYRDEFTDFA